MGKDYMATVKTVQLPAQVSTFNKAGTFTWTCPKNVHKVSVLVQNGGDGSYGYRSNNMIGQGSYYHVCMSYKASSGYACMVENIDVNPGEVYTIIVGAGGAGGTCGSTLDSGYTGSTGSPSTAFGVTPSSSNNTCYYKKRGTYTTVYSTNDPYNSSAYKNYAATDLIGSVSNPYEIYNDFESSILDNGGAGFHFKADKDNAGSSGKYQNGNKGSAGMVKIYY